MIIVLMICFNPCFNGYSTLTYFYVDGVLKDSYGFNPYFNGYSTLTGRIGVHNELRNFCFNPYFNGYSTLTRTFEKILYLSVLQRFFQTLKLHFFD